MMGMSMSVYVGPYLQVEIPDDKIDDLLDKYQKLVQDGRGESGGNDADLYLIPNVDLPDVSRPMTFERDGGDYKPVNIQGKMYECHAFSNLVRPVEQELSAIGCKYKECWGIVTGWF